MNIEIIMITILSIINTILWCREGVSFGIKKERERMVKGNLKRGLVNDNRKN